MHSNDTIRTVISVQARLGSTRLPGKALLELGDDRVIERVVDQCSMPDGPNTFVTTGDSPENAAIEEWCRREGVACVTGPEDDLLQRHRAVADQAEADRLVRVTGDCPFVPRAEIRRILAEHNRGDARYTTNNTDAMPIGTAVDVVDRSLLDELAEIGATHPVRQPRDRPGRWGSAFSPNPEWEALADAHIAVDTPGDYWALVDAVAAVDDDPRAVGEWVSERDSVR